MTESSNQKYLVTGAAGFIGKYIDIRLLEQGFKEAGLGSLNDYDELELKLYRLAKLLPYADFRFLKMDLANRDGMAGLFKAEQFTRVIH